MILKLICRVTYVGIVLFLVAFTTNQDENEIEYKNTYAVVIGIADYKYENTAPDLHWTINDAEKFVKFLKSDKGGNVPTENIYILKNDKAKKANIMKYARQLFEKANSEDRVIFYWSGHGIGGAFIPYDGFYNKETNKAYNLLFFSDLKEIMKSAKCKVKLIFADACHSGSLKQNTEKKVVAQSKSLKPKAININDVEVAVMVAASADEYSMEYTSLKQGVFSFYLIEGLEGEADRNADKKVTIKELHDYVFKKVKSFNPKQTPITFGKFDKDMVVSNLK